MGRGASTCHTISHDTMSISTTGPMTLGSKLGIEVRATPPQVLSIRPCKLKFNEEKSKHAGLNQ